MFGQISIFQAVSDRDNEVKKLKDENAKGISDLEKQLASESSNSQQLQVILNSPSDRLGAHVL